MDPMHHWSQGKDVEDAGGQAKDEPGKPIDLVDSDGNVMLLDGFNAPL